MRFRTYKIAHLQKLLIYGCLPWSQQVGIVNMQVYVTVHRVMIGTTRNFKRQSVKRQPCPSQFQDLLTIEVKVYKVTKFLGEGLV